MTTNLKIRYQRGTPANNPDNVEVKADGRLVVDGHDVDLEHLLPTEPYLSNRFPLVAHRKDGGAWDVTLTIFDNSASPPDETETVYSAANSNIPAYPIWPDGVTEAAQTISTTALTPAAPLIARLQQACHETRQQFIRWARELAAFGVTVLERGIKYLEGAWYCIKQIAEDTTLSILTRIIKIELAAQGALDVDGTEAFSLVVDSYPDPTNSSIWVNDDAERVNLLDSVVYNETYTSLGLNQSSWIAALAA
ncbi:MAG: hypothetical protein J4F41_00010 [Alphaproteobacteria bacterium]|nr:hypothetical protein [Alphaproteobacteria bacterium]